MFKLPMTAALLCLTAGFSALPSIASADWDVQKSEEDVFGNVNVTVTSIGDNGTLLRFECGTGKDPLVAMLMPDSTGDIGPIPAMMIMKDASGELVKGGAVLASWNDQYAAIVTNESEFLQALAEEMISTSKNIPIGGEVPGYDIQISDTFSPRGSTAAGEAVKAGCFGE